ncbi:MAG TPA: PadR family transcriptional regulator [Gemmatimonadaceae bacterium]|nr:PadR family transcriptional regulator [Gemmatimonadaceae bacterium]
MAEQLPLMKGTVDMLVLKALSWGPMHGFGIATWLEQRSSGALGLDDSAMYQVLHRLEGRGFVEAEWAVTDNNRNARYYKLTPEGRAYLRETTANWLQYSASVTSIVTSRSKAV